MRLAARFSHTSRSLHRPSGALGRGACVRAPLTSRGSLRLRTALGAQGFRRSGAADLLEGSTVGPLEVGLPEVRLEAPLEAPDADLDLRKHATATQLAPREGSHETAATRRRRRSSARILERMPRRWFARGDVMISGLRRGCQGRRHFGRAAIFDFHGPRGFLRRPADMEEGVLHPGLWKLRLHRLRRSPRRLRPQEGWRDVPEHHRAGRPALLAGHCKDLRHDLHTSISKHATCRITRNVHVPEDIREQGEPWPAAADPPPARIAHEREERRLCGATFGLSAQIFRPAV